MSREYAERWFPEFVKQFDKTLKEVNGEVRKDMSSVPHPTTGFKKDRPYIRPEHQKSKKWFMQKVKKVDDVAQLALEGKNKSEIGEILNLKMNTVQSYLSVARGKGILPKDFIVVDGIKWRTWKPRPYRRKKWK